VRATAEAITGAVTGPLAAPRTLLLGPYDTRGRLQSMGRSTTLSQTADRALAVQPAPPSDGHPWQGGTFTAGWGTRGPRPPADAALRR
jgi:hypothetical protein